MSKEHHIVMIPGLNDQNFLQKKAMELVAQHWKRYGVVGHVVSPNWEDGESFKIKLRKILKVIDELVDKAYAVSVLGLSAGGSAALNAFALRKKVLKAAVNGTGRLKAGENVRPSLRWAARNSPAFAQSVLLFENKNEPTLSKSDRRKILTLRPQLDEIVPSPTVAVAGADNRIMPVVGHLLGGAYVGLVMGKEILAFLNKRK